MEPNDLWKIFQKNELDFFTGVPDSTFKSWMKFLDEKNNKILTNRIATNECEAIAIAAGYHLATKKIGIVYMQNAGFGKTINPLTSLADPDVYSIPMLLMIGWRGEPGKKDEPQHVKMGRILIKLLEVLEIKCSILPDNTEKCSKIISDAKDYVLKNNCQYAFLIQSGTIEENSIQSDEEDINYEMKREEALEIILENIREDTIIIATTGKTSRELYELRIKRKEKPRDFYTVGSMGCSAAIAFGISENTSKKIIILDGDGSVLMQMGTLATVGYYQPSNYIHVILNNRCYESTGGQPTVSGSVDFEKLALSCNYKSSYCLDTKKELKDLFENIEIVENPSLIVINVKRGSRENLGRPKTTPIENKEYFMNQM